MTNRSRFRHSIVTISPARKLRSWSAGLTADTQSQSAAGPSNKVSTLRSRSTFWAFTTRLSPDRNRVCDHLAGNRSGVPPIIDLAHVNPLRSAIAAVAESSLGLFGVLLVP
jgi:hypothetical protein